MASTMPTIKFNQQKLEDLVQRRGRGVLWERAVRCSCYNEFSGNPLMTCKACDGKGYIYDEPVYEDAVLVTSLVTNKEFTPIGEYHMGDAVCVVPYQKKNTDIIPHKTVDVPMYWIGERDKVTLTTSQFKATEAVHKGRWLRQSPPDTLRYEYVTEILRVIQADSDTGIVTVYEPNVDYRISKTQKNKIEWIPTGQAPADETFYTVMYLHNPTYIVYTDLPQPRDQDGQRLPKKVILRFSGVI